MLHIVLVLLKIIGIILASILGLLLLLILMVLLVPIRYRLSADNQEELEAEAKISWLLRLIYIRAYYSDNKFVIKLRICGRIFYDSSNTAEKGQKKDKSSKIKNTLKKPGVKQQDRKRTRSETETKGNLPAKVNTAELTKKEVKTVKRIEESEIEESEIKESMIIDSKDIGSLNKVEPDSFDTAELRDNEAEIKKPEQLEAKSVIISENQMLTEQYKADLTDNHREDELDELYSDTMLKAAEIKPGDRERRTGSFSKIRDFFSKIGGIFSKIKEFFSKLKNFFISLKERFKKIMEKIFNLHGKWEKIKVFLSNNKAAFSKSFVSIKRILRHIKPTKLKLDLEFGTGDPSSTGQVLGLLAVFYGYYGKSMQVIPNFEEEILKGSLFCLGRIRLLTLLIICMQLILDKNFRNLLKNFKTLKEDL